MVQCNASARSWSSDYYIIIPEWVWEWKHKVNKRIITKLKSARGEYLQFDKRI